MGYDVYQCNKVETKVKAEEGLRFFGFSHLNLDLNLNLDSHERGATGFDGDTEVTVACRALGNS